MKNIWRIENNSSFKSDQAPDIDLSIWKSNENTESAYLAKKEKRNNYKKYSNYRIWTSSLSSWDSNLFF